jgi:hypothetical protein
LGITIDQGLKFKTQITETVQKKTTEFSRMKGILGREWGIKFNTSLILYKTIYIPRTTYAAIIWRKD